MDIDGAPPAAVDKAAEAIRPRSRARSLLAGHKSVNIFSADDWSLVKSLSGPQFSARMSVDDAKWIASCGHDRTVALGIE